MLMVLKKHKRQKIDASVDPLGSPSEAVSKAHDLMKGAVVKSFQLPSDVVAAVTDARHSVDRTGGFADAELETRFWNAYGLLSSIRPVEVARRRYKAWFYVFLILLLVCQLYYLAGSLVSKRLTDVETEWQHLTPGVAQPAGADVVKASSPTPAEAWVQLRRRATARANYVLGALLMPWYKEFPVEPPRPGNNDPSVFQTLHFSPDVELFAKNYMKMKGELEVALCSLSGYILPLLYGAMGAFAFILRKLSDPVGRLTYAYDARVSYTLRLHIGALGGLAVGWFINGNAPISGLGGSAASGLVALSPLALAFAAGYASDLLFTALDKVVAAFSPMPSSAERVTEQRTLGGMTVTTETQREARVAGGSVSAPLLPDPEKADPGKPTEPGLATAAEPRPKAA